MIISFSFLSLLNENYKDAIINFNKLNSNNWLHCDVMDGKFVSNTTFDYSLIESINQYNKLFCDVHLMIENPGALVKDYVRAGADQITIHYETQNIKETIDIIKKIQSFNIKAGVSIKPTTKVEELMPLLKYLDYILVMSVEPGKGGQEFIPASISKIKYLKQQQKHYRYLIGVDGGVNQSNSQLLKDAGADVVVVGTYLANNLNSETINNLI